MNQTDYQLQWENNGLMGTLALCPSYELNWFLQPTTTKQTFGIKIRMRYQGKIVEWNEARGFGFIMWNGGNDKMFVHISAFNERQRRPVVGDIVTYEVSKDGKGRHHAQNVAFARSALSKPYAKSSTTLSLRSIVAAALIVVIGVGAFLQYRPKAAFTSSAFSTQPASGVESIFRCEGKTHCTQMTSCEEATYYLKNCPGTEMDGNRDGVPCERQWCH